MEGKKKIDLKLDNFLDIMGYLYLLAFFIRLAADYYKYLNGFNSTPIYVFVVDRGFTFLLPSIVCFVVAKYLKKRRTGQ